MDRRTRNVKAYLYGGLVPRRRGGRRAEDQLYPIIDWHSPRVLALVLAILGLCTMDGVLTIVLLGHGAVEANPVMALFVPHNLPWFAAVKLGLTALGLMVLVACSRMRFLRRIPGEASLYLVLIAYATLIVYELRLLPQIQDTFAETQASSAVHSHSIHSSQ